MMKMQASLRNKEGNGTPLAVCVTISLLMIMLVISQFIHLIIISTGVKDAMQKAVISVINDNYADVYHAVREGYSAGYQPTGEGSFNASVNEGDIYGRLDDLLGLQDIDGYHYKISSNKKQEFRISNLKVTISNPPLSSGNRVDYIATAKIQLEVPVSFLQKALPDMKINLQMKAAYTPKF